MTMGVCGGDGMTGLSLRLWLRLRLLGVRLRLPWQTIIGLSRWGLRLRLRPLFSSTGTGGGCMIIGCAIGGVQGLMGSPSRGTCGTNGMEREASSAQMERVIVSRKEPLEGTRIVRRGSRVGIWTNLYLRQAPIEIRHEDKTRGQCLIALCAN